MSSKAVRLVLNCPRRGNFSRDCRPALLVTSLVGFLVFVFLVVPLLGVVPVMGMIGLSFADAC